MPKQNGFMWFELQCDNPDAAVDFYTSVIPWGTQEWRSDDDDETYTMFTVDGTTLGAVMQLPEEAKAKGAPTHWLGYISTDDLEAKLNQLENLGGRNESDIIDIGEHGRLAVVSDPQGAHFTLHEMPESYDEQQWDGLPEQNQTGACSWCELWTDDIDAAWSFYSEMFGWDKGERMTMENGQPYQIVGWNGRDRGGISANPDPNEPAGWMYYFTVEDIDAAADRIKKHGGDVIHGPMEVPGGDRVAICTDHEGGHFAIHYASGAGMAE